MYLTINTYLRIFHDKTLKKIFKDIRVYIYIYIFNFYLKHNSFPSSIFKSNFLSQYCILAIMFNLSRQYN